MSSNAPMPRSRLGYWINEFEETAIAVLLGVMTLITFANVVLRYGFNTGLIWGLEDNIFVCLVGALRCQLCGEGHRAFGRRCPNQYFCTENPPHSDADRGGGLRCLCWLADERGLGLLG